MHRKHSYWLILTLLLVHSCKSNNNPTTSSVIITDTANYFDLNSYLKAQINEVLETPYYIYKITNSNNQQDSVPLSKTDFASWSKILLTNSINDSINRQYYKETSFGNYANNTITLSYTCTNNALPVQQISIIIGEESKQVQRVFINAWQKNEEEDCEIKMGLKANESIMINKTITKKNGEIYKALNIIVWNKATANL